MFQSSPVLRWRKYNEKYLLEGNLCLSCRKIYYPKAYLCQCGSERFDDAWLSSLGEVLAFTQIFVPPSSFSETAPYYIALIQLDEGPKLVTQIADTESSNLKIGTRVRAAFRKYSTYDHDGTINYGLKFVSFE